MKRLLCLALVVAMIGLDHAYCQNESEPTRKPLSIGGFGGPFLEFSSGLDGLAFGSGGGGGVILGDFFLGGFGMGLDQDNRQVNGTSFDADLGMGGLWVGYVPMVEKRIHPYLSTKIGWGELDIYQDLVDKPVYEDGFLAIQSDLGIELNVLPFWKIALVASYRSFELLDALPDGITENRLGGWMGGMTMRFGGFPE